MSTLFDDLQEGLLQAQMTESEINNLDKVIEGLECCENCFCEYCKQEDASKYRWDCPANDRLNKEALILLKDFRQKFVH